MAMTDDQKITDNLKYLKLLSSQYPTIQSASSEIINLEAILDLPKGTEHFMSDLHGEHEAFTHILHNASGVIREKIDAVYGHTVEASKRALLATLIYYPEQKLSEIKQKNRDLNEWYRITLHRLIEVCRLVTSKYPRSKVRRALPAGFAHIIDELLHTDYDQHNKEEYYDRIITTIIAIERADAFIIALCGLIKELAVARLHIVGDIFDRGPRADIIMDCLLDHHCVDIQWGNHDVVWMGAAAGSGACIANVLNTTLQYNNLDFLENGYGINLRKLIAFAQEVYGDCACFAPKLMSYIAYDPKDSELVTKLHKAIAIIQFKLEGQLIQKHPEYEMEHRLLLHKIDYAAKTVEIDGETYALRDVDFPTVDPADPYVLSEGEEELMEHLKLSFMQSERLQQHVKFLYAKGGMYKCYNSNLLFHGCIPLNEDGSFYTYRVDGKSYSGKAFLDYAQLLARQAYFSPEGSAERENGKDFLWYLWSGPYSPSFGRYKMATFEKYLVEDPKSCIEAKNPYYAYIGSAETCKKILSEFGLDPETSHIVNGHVPVKTKDGENPVKADGRLIVIDGGFCRAYQPTTGIAGYTLIYNSHGLRLVSHEAFSSTERAILENRDILSTSTIFETVQVRRKIADTDAGKKIISATEDLKLLLAAYRRGYIKEKNDVREYRLIDIDNLL